jgi:hypothetical protein
MKTRFLCAVLAVFVMASLTFGQQQPTQPQDSGKDQAASDTKKNGGKDKTSENPVETGVVKGSKATAKGAKYAGQAAADGSKQAAKGVTKGAKWVARPWKKDKSEKKDKPVEPDKSKDKTPQ